ncbi:multiheme c-type cytochrome [Pirellulaceae bacterium SH449]
MIFKPFITTCILLFAVLIPTAAAIRLDDRHGKIETKNALLVATHSANEFSGHGDRVSSATCAECHAEIYASYTEHPMWNSIRGTAQDDDRAWTKGDQFIIPGKKRVLKAERDSKGRTVHSESMFDATGKLIYQQSHTMDFVVGSGQRAKAYIRQVGERLYVSPLNWYHRDDLWALAPGYRQDDVRRFHRRATEDCLGCHSGFPNSLEAGSDRFGQKPFHEMEIGCERCHGNGSGHVAHQRGDVESIDSQEDIKNPSKLSIEQREAVCYQCHLEARARVLRPGKTHLDFQPGMLLSDIWAIVDHGAEIDADSRTRAVNHVQQMRDSVCFNRSDKQMGCISCHDPHSTPSEANKLEFYRSRCNSCHTGVGSGSQTCSETNNNRSQRGDDCIACHMPNLSSTNMTHVAQTDHRILRKPFDQQESESAQSTLTFFDNHGDRFPGTEKERNLVLGTIIHCQRRGIPIPDSVLSFLKELVKVRQNDAALFVALGSMTQSKGDMEQARRYYQTAVNIEPTNVAALDGLFDTAFLLEKWQECINLSEKLLSSEPQYARVIAMRGEAFARLGSMNEAIQEWEKAVAIDPGFEALHEILAEVYASLGKQEQSVLHRDILERLRTSKIPNFQK